MSEGFRVSSKGRLVADSSPASAIGYTGTSTMETFPAFGCAGGTVSAVWPDRTLVSMGELQTKLARMEEQVAKLEELVMQVYDHPLMPGGQQVLQDFENEHLNTN